MTEIKGQLLGMLLVLLIFSLVGGVIYASFKSNADDLSSKLNSEMSMVDDDGA